MSAETTVDRSRPPRPGAPPELEIPPVERFRLSSGVRVWVLERPRLPEVSLRLAVDAGASAEPADRSGVAELTARLLTEGAAG
ncbi:MAG: insulinase family protein, partial [Gemmatimonadota bacterium]